MDEPEKSAIETREQPQIKNFAGLLLLLLVLLLIVSLAGQYIYDYINPDKYSSSEEEAYGENTENCNVWGIDLHGSLYSYLPPVDETDPDADTDSVASEHILSVIIQAEKDEDTKAIMLEVDSPGGSPVAGEEVANALKAATKPVVGYIRQSGMSAAYWAVSTADRIFASKNSDVGSIGVTMSYIDNVAKNKNEGLSYVQLTTGKYKDAGTPDRTLTLDERELFMRDLKIIHENFVEAVSINRNIPIEKVRAIADGSSVLGARALELGLIDEIGGYAEAKKYIEEQIGETAEVCW